MIDSKRSANSADDIYVSTLWYYDLLMFTMDQELPTASRPTSNINSEENQISICTEGDEDDADNNGEDYEENNESILEVQHEQVRTHFLFCI